VLKNGTLITSSVVICFFIAASGTVDTLVFAFIGFVSAVSAFVLRAGAVPALLLRLAVLCDMSEALTVVAAGIFGSTISEIILLLKFKGVKTKH
jgi:hypothetical protein